ncbi:unnamed protein product, partial [Symbiodinium sp. KB8]
LWKCRAWKVPSASCGDRNSELRGLPEVLRRGAAEVGRSACGEGIGCPANTAVQHGRHR